MLDRVDDGLHAARTAEFRHEATTRDQRALDAAQHVGRARHPVQCRVGEYGVELGLVAQLLTIGDLEAQIDVLLSRAFDHCSRAIDAGHLRTLARDLRGQRAGATAEIQNSLTRTRAQPGHEVRGELRHEGSAVVIQRGVPSALAIHGQHAGSAQTF